MVPKALLILYQKLASFHGIVIFSKFGIVENLDRCKIIIKSDDNFLLTQASSSRIIQLLFEYDEKCNCKYLECIILSNKIKDKTQHNYMSPFFP